VKDDLLTEYKVINVTFSENASIVIRADTPEQAEELLWENFTHIPDLRIISIEDADPEVVAELKAQREDEDEEETRTLN
jgi:ribosomal protein S10